MCAHFAMPVPVPSGVCAGQGDDPLAARVAAGPGMWDDEDWLAELRRDGLIGELLASGTIGQAAAEGGHGHRLERALTAEMTLLCLAAGALFPGQGYDLILARTFSMPGTRVRPGTPVPTGPALSQARTRLGEQPMRRAFELDAARDDVPLAAGGTAFGLELVIFDGTTLDLFNCPELAAEFGVPEGGKHPKLRLVALLQAGTMRWKAAAIGGYHDGENALADQLEGALGPGQLSLADRGFFSMDRWLRFSAAGSISCGGSRTPPAQSRSACSGHSRTDRGWSCSAKAPACWAGAGRKQATGRCPGCRTPSPASSASPS